MRHVLGGLALVVALASSVAEAAPGDLATRFGKREEIQQISLSPDGTKVALIAPSKSHGNTVVVADTVSGTVKPILSASGMPDRLTDCHWSTDTRLVCNLYIILNGGLGRLGYTRTLAIDADGSRMKLLSTSTSQSSLNVMQDGGRVIDWSGTATGSSVLMTRMFVPENSTGTNLAERRAGLGVDRVDTVTLARRTVEQPRADASEYITDGNGNVRIMGVRARTSTGLLSGRTTYLYRRAPGAAWERLSEVTGSATGQSSGFDPYAVDAAKNVAYGFDDKDGRAALYRVSLDGGLKREVVLARDDVDVDGLIQVGRQHRVVGTSYALEQRQTEYFDPALVTLRAALGRAFPGDHLVSIVDASADESKLLIYIGSDADPGRYYLYDKATRHLAELLPARGALAAQKLATVKAITFKAADGTVIPAYLTLPPGSSGRNLPAIVMPHGGPAARDEWGFDWLSQFYAARGFAVLQPQFRGSTGYGGGWFQKNGFQSWQVAIGDVTDAGRYLLSSGVAAPGKLAIVGWSYGGYAALQSSVVAPDLFKAVVAIAPVTDLETLRAEAHGFTNAALVDRFIGHGPHVSAGSPAQNAGRIGAPVLLFHGDQDQNVGVGESRMMAARLRGAGKPVDYVEFNGLDHQLADDEARATLLDRSDTFLRDTLKP